MLTLNDKQVKQLEDFVSELPTKFGLPLLNLLRSFSTENEPNSPKEDLKAVKATPVEAE